MPAGPAAKHDRAAGERLVEVVARPRLDDLEPGVLCHRDARRPAVAALHHVWREGEQGHLGALATQQLGGAQPDRPDPDHRAAAAFQRHSAADAGDGGGRRRVGAVRVEHDRRVERLEEQLLSRFEHRLAVSHPGAADPESGVGEPVGTAREDRALDEVSEIVRGDFSVPDDDVDVGVVRGDCVERARVLIGVQLDQDLLHWMSSRRGSGKLNTPQSSGPSWR